MPLNLGHRRGNGEDTVSSLRYSAKTDSWSTWNDTFRKTVVLPSDFVGVFDFQCVRTGYLAFEQGQPPDFAWDVDGVPHRRPSPSHKRGFSVLVYIEHVGLRDLCSNAVGVCAAISDAFDEYEADPRAAQGLLPVLRPGPAKLIEGRDDREPYYEPCFELVDWTPRPKELPKRAPPEPSPGGGPTPDEKLPF